MYTKIAASAYLKERADIVFLVRSSLRCCMAADLCERASLGSIQRKWHSFSFSWHKIVTFWHIFPHLGRTHVACQNVHCKTLAGRLSLDTQCKCAAYVAMALAHSIVIVHMTIVFALNEQRIDNVGVCVL